MNFGNRATTFLEMSSPSRRTASQSDLFGNTGALPAGFRYFADVLPVVEEASLIEQFQTLPFKPFEFHGYLGNRRVVSFGYRYDYGRQTLGQADEMPEFLKPLRSAAAAVGGLPEDQLVQALVTEYAPGAGIGWHRDKPMFERVVALSFGAPCVLRLRQKVGIRWDRASVPIAPRSVYLLSGTAREDWEHSIAPMEKLRYSVTFRSFKPDYVFHSD